MRVTLFKILLYLVVFTIPGTTLGNMVTRRHFDRFDDNYLTYGVGLGGNGETVVSGTKFDAVGAGWSLVSEPILNDYAFIYEYDECMRVVSKKLPGCEPVRYCYDRCGQLAFSQDGNQRDEGRRMFYLYDTAGRPTMTGLCDAPSTWAVYTDTAMISSRADNRAIDKTYYSAPVHLGNPKMLNAWYYDTYINLPGHYYDLSVVRNGLLTISSSALMPPVGDQDRIVTSNYYDFDDRLCESTTDIAGGGTINTHTVYTLSDQVDSVWTTTRLPGKTAIVDRYKYRYDHADRLKSVTYYHDGDAPIVLAVNDYDALGRLATAKLPGETVNYAYNVRNALTAITSPRFSQQLRYAAGASNPCYNGNIAEAVTQGNKYAYTYDNANRLTAAKYTPSAGNADYSATYAYDRNSNITALTRKGLTGRLGTFGTVDDLTLTYDGNQLSKVTETADEILLETSHDMQPMAITRPTVSQFRYDANGNTTIDHPRSISSITYNPLNLPQSVTIDDTPSGMISSLRDKKYINYTYDASGVKHRVIHSSTKPDVSPTGRLTTADTTDYVGNRVYLNGKLDKVLTPYGYLQGGKFHTWLHDYQGNIVAVVVGDSVAQHNSYYPYGLPHATLSFRTNVTTNTPNTYKYSGKEFDTFGGTDLYDFHARYHAPSTGRFMTVDPMAEDYYGYSIYLYCMGNPIALIDPSGLGAFWHNGTEIGTDGINDGKVYALKTTEESFSDNLNSVPGAGLSKDALNATISFIKSNDGNAEAFKGNSIAYDNSIEIEPSASNRQEMVNIVSKDDGRGGASDSNNQEYGGYIQDGVVSPNDSGPVVDPNLNQNGEITTKFGLPTFHSHPSGTGKSSQEPKHRFSSTKIGGSKPRGHFQPPSPQDIQNAGSTTNYVFGRGNKKVYVYTRDGVQAVIPMKNFVNPHIPSKKK